jgi:AbrB family looped-hinge helix DNA binding protein
VKYLSELDENKFVYGTVKVGARGQIVIPKEARDAFNINPGDNVMIAGDISKGLAIISMDKIRDFLKHHTIETFEGLSPQQVKHKTIHNSKKNNK